MLDSATPTSTDVVPSAGPSMAVTVPARKEGRHPVRLDNIVLAFLEGVAFLSAVGAMICHYVMVLFEK